jgi:mRNA interferase MazF
MSPSNFPRQGEVYWTALDPTVGSEIQKTRPCVVVTANEINQRRRTVVVIPLSTTSPKDFPLYVPLLSVSQDSQAVIDQIRAVDRSRLGDWKATVTQAEMDTLVYAMGIVFAVE